jgi:glycosyltransferase involved in cell wall biosynthesis
MLLLRSLEVGGAERQATELAIGMRRRGIEVRVAVFYRRGPFIELLEHEGIEIVDLRKRGRWDLAGFFVRAAKLIRRSRADVLYSFLGGANIAAAILDLAIPRLKIVWSIRSSDVDLSRYDWTHRLGYRIERALARRPKLIIANSVAGRDFAVRHGFPDRLIRVVPNGIDIERFRPDPALRAQFRKSWSLAEDRIVIGMLARLDPMKDYPTFLRAGALVAGAREDVILACVGEGPLDESLKALAAGLGLAERVLFTGRWAAEEALNGFDLACSASITEGFPNAVAEAMACGKPCIVTDAGDSALIVGDCGSVVPVRDPEALADAIFRELGLLGAERSAAPRGRIVENFSVSRMVVRNLAILADVTGCGLKGKGGELRGAG